MVSWRGPGARFAVAARPTEGLTKTDDVKISNPTNAAARVPIRSSLVELVGAFSRMAGTLLRACRVVNVRTRVIGTETPAARGKTGNFALTAFIERPNVTRSSRPLKWPSQNSLWKPAMVLPRNRISTPALARGKVQSIDRCRYAEANFEQHDQTISQSALVPRSRHAPCARDHSTGVRLGPFALERPRLMPRDVAVLRVRIREEVT